MADASPLRARAYGALLFGASWLHYAVLSRFGPGDEGGVAWFRRRLAPVYPSTETVDGPRIWIHAVSAGESKVALALRGALLAADPALSIVMSSTTYSGFGRISKAVGNDAFVMPLDTPAAQAAVFGTVRPDLLVLIESEFWPAQFAAAEAAGVPVVVVNAILSERSFARHQRFPGFARRTILRLARVFAQDETTAARYRALGMPPERIEVCGNLKLAPSAGVSAWGVFDPQRRLVTFGNVHAAELDALAPAVLALRRARPDIGLVLVPRYPGRIPPEVLRRRFGEDLAITNALPDNPGGVIWLDSMGVLMAAYAASAVGVVCGTFAPIGGHDLAEPLQAGAASVYGPRVERQRSLHATLAGVCAEQVTSAEALPAAVLRLLDNPATREARLQRFGELSAEAEIGLQSLAAKLAVIANPVKS